LASSRATRRTSATGDAGALGGARGDDGHAGQALALEDVLEVGDGDLEVGLAQPVGLVQHHDRGVLVRRERLEVARVDRGVRVLLRVEDPHEQVGVLRDVVDQLLVGLHDRVVVGQVEQHEALEGVVLRRVEDAAPGDLVAAGHADPVEQLGGSGRPPRAGERRCGRGAQVADLGQLEAGEPVEQRGLARAGGPGQHHDGVLGGQLEALGGVRERGGRRVGVLGVDDVARGVEGRLEGGDALVELAHRRLLPRG